MALLLYAVTLGGTYIYDDISVIRDEPRLHQPWQWLRFASDSYNGGVDNLYRPLVSWSFALQWRVTGDRPGPMHAVNWVLHAAAAALVAELARRLSGVRAAYIAGLLFAVHPIHVEAVANLVGRAELMCAAGALGALVLLLHRPMTIARALAVAGCMVLAMLSKEQGMLLPLLIVLLAITSRLRGASGTPVSRWVERFSLLFTVGPRTTDPRDDREHRATIVLMLLVCWIAAGLVLYREHILKFEWDRTLLGAAEQPMIRCAALDRLLMPLVLLGRYTALLAAPLHLSPDYGGHVIGYSVHANDWYLYLGAAAILGYAIAIVMALRFRDGPMLFCLLAAGAMYAVVGNIFTLIGTNFAERLMYLPSAFLLIALAMAVSQLPRQILIVSTTIAMLLASVRSYTYARRWNDRLRFYEACSLEQPRSVRLHMLVTAECLSEGKLDEAVASAAAGRAAMPEYAEVWIQSAAVALARGELDQADAFLHEAEKIKPSAKVVAWQQKVADARSRSPVTSLPVP